MDSPNLSSPDQESAQLSRLLEKNYNHHALLLADGMTHSHMAHILISAYKLHASPEHLEATYDIVSTDLTPWTVETDTNLQIASDDDLFQHLGDKEYQHAFIHFFNRRLDDFQGDWATLVKHYLLETSKPMLGGLVGGFAHPLILLADAVDVGSAHVAVEALALNACDSNALHAVVDAQPKVRQEDGEERTPLQLLGEMKNDSRFDDLLKQPGVANTMLLLRDSNARKAFLGFVDALDLQVDAPEEAAGMLSELIEAALLLLCTIHMHSDSPDNMTPHAFDFYLTHQLTFCWCLHILIPFLPSSATSKLLRIGWMMMVLTYANQLRPQIKPELLDSVQLADDDPAKTWTRLTEVALGATKERGMDPHFVKVIRTLKEFAELWPDKAERFLKVCVRFEAEFSGWTGFGAAGEELMDVS